MEYKRECTNCHFISYNYQYEGIVRLSIPKKRIKVNLYDCIENTFNLRRNNLTIKMCENEDCNINLNHIKKQQNLFLGKNNIISGKTIYI